MCLLLANYQLSPLTAQDQDSDLQQSIANQPYFTRIEMKQHMHQNMNFELPLSPV
jgi:hypothetical protein